MFFSTGLFGLFQEVFDVDNPQCLIDALLRHQIREKLPNGKSVIDAVDIHMITQEAVGAGLCSLTIERPCVHILKETPCKFLKASGVSF